MRDSGHNAAMDYAMLIKEVGRGSKGSRDLTEEQAEELFGAILDGRVPDMELGALLLSLRIKGEAEGELRGFKRALDARTPQFSVPPEGARAIVIPTYNGARRQPNLVPLLALLLHRQGLPVLLHGRHDFDSRVSPFELLERLGIRRVDSLAEAGNRLAGGEIACVGLEVLCPGLDRLLALRPRLGVRNAGHSVAKLLDPLKGRSTRLVAVTHPEYIERMRLFLGEDGGSALLMRGTEGEAYANPRRRPQLEGFLDGRSHILFPAEDGGAPPLEGLPESPEPEANAACIRAMLEGRLAIPGPILDQAAACLHLAGKVGSLGEAAASLRS